MTGEERRALRQAVDEGRRAIVASEDRGARQRQALPIHRQPTSREFEVLQLVADGAVCKEAALKLGISFGTARNHMANVKEKLGAVTATNACVIALRRGWIE